MPIYMKYDGIDGDVTRTSGAIGGVWKTTNFITADSPSGVYLSSISLPNSPFEFRAVDSRDANAASKVATLFAAVRSSGASSDVVISVPKTNNLQAFRVLNHLRQAAASGRTIPSLELFANDDGNPRGVIFQIRNARIISASDGSETGRGGSGKASYRDMQFVVRVSKASPILMLQCASGSHI